MAEGVFLIQEMKFRAGFGFIADPDGERFEWYSDRDVHDPVSAALLDPQKGGGARAAPLRPWKFGGQLRTKRTDYPGAKTPTEQVLGPNQKPFTLNGTWDDRYNFQGYAVKEKRRFEEMCRRGNIVLMQYGEEAFNVLITDWDIDWRRKWDIGYSFTVSNHDRTEDFDIADRSPSTAKSAQQAVEEAQLLVQQALATQDAAPVASMLKKSTDGVPTADRIDRALNSMSQGVNAVSDTLDNVSNTISRPVDQFKRMATQFRNVRELAGQVISEMIEIRSDVELGVQTATSVLDLEVWSRSLRFNMRVLLGQTTEASRDLDERADPEAQAVYRPQKDESLYAISRRFYGTPYAWRLIADRNSLRVFVMTGDEVLIIPARGEG